MKEFIIGAIGFAAVIIVGGFAKSDKAILWSCIALFAEMALWCATVFTKYINLTAGVISALMWAGCLLFCFAMLKHENTLRRKKFEMAQKLAESAEAEKNRM